MIKTIFLDFDGVIRHWSGPEVTDAEMRLGVPKGTLFKQAFAKPFLIPAITGEVTHEQWQELVEQELAQARSAQIAKQLINAWNSASFEIDHSFLEQIREIATAAQIALVTNATSKLNLDLAACGLHGRFDLIINSSVIGIAKPDEGFYKKALELAQTKAEQSIFIDDSHENVTAAREIGIHAHHHTNKADTIAFIQHCFSQ